MKKFVVDVSEKRSSHRFEWRMRGVLIQFFVSCLHAPKGRSATVSVPSSHSKIERLGILALYQSLSPFSWSSRSGISWCSCFDLLFIFYAVYDSNISLWLCPQFINLGCVSLWQSSVWFLHLYPSCTRTMFVRGMWIHFPPLRRNMIFFRRQESVYWLYLYSSLSSSSRQETIWEERDLVVPFLLWHCRIAGMQIVQSF